MQNQGFVLITLLIFMLILSALGLYGIEMAILETKMANFNWQHHSLFNAANSALNVAEINVMSSTPHCLIPISNPNQIIKQPLSWWNALACRRDDPQYIYFFVIERLGVDPCALIDQLDIPKKIAANYFRVTLLGLSKVGNAKVFLQSLIAKPNFESDSSICEGTIRSVQLGRQMWRVITNDI